MYLTQEKLFNLRTYYSGELKSDKEGFTFSIDLPGIEKESIDMSYENKKVHLKATRKKGESEWIYEESFSLPYSIESIEAQLDQGVLFLKGKWKEEEKAKTIAWAS